MCIEMCIEIDGGEGNLHALPAPSDSVGERLPEAAVPDPHRLGRSAGRRSHREHSLRFAVHPRSLLFAIRPRSDCTANDFTVHPRSESTFDPTLPDGTRSAASLLCKGRREVRERGRGRGSRRGSCGRLIQ